MCGWFNVNVGINYLIQIAEATCMELGVEGALLEGCIYDVAVTNDTSFSQQESLKTG